MKPKHFLRDLVKRQHYEAIVAAERLVKTARTAAELNEVERLRRDADRQRRFLRMM